MFYKDIVKQIMPNNNFLQMEKYVNYLEEKNKIINLTGFKGDEIWKEGIYESIMSLKDFQIEGKLLDIGAGGGFPSIPFVIINPNIALTIIESNKKKFLFLKEVKNILNLNIKIINKRAEEVLNNYKYDFITARAVTSLSKLIEITYHLGKIKSKFLFIKGPKVYEEIKNAKSLLKKLNIGIKVKKINKISYKEVNVVNFVKNKKHPQNMPKKWNQIKN